MATNPVPSRFGGYDIQSRLGTGATGEVYLAKDLSGREVALRLLDPKLAGDSEIDRRFRQETRAAMSIDHPHLARVLDAGRGDGRLFVASEFVPGGSLQHLLQRSERIPIERAVAIFRDLMAALEAIQKARLCHRDVKPANILFDAEGRARLVDLGVAPATRGQGPVVARRGRIVGTPQYMAPEQVRGEAELDIRTDLYAAGIVLFESIAGEPPFYDDDFIKVFWMHAHTPVPALSSQRPGSPAELDGFVRELLEKEVEKRPDSAADVLRRLGGIDLGGSAPIGEFPATMVPDSKPRPRDIPEVPLADFPNTMIEGAPKQPPPPPPAEEFPNTMIEGPAAQPPPPPPPAPEPEPEPDPEPEPEPEPEPLELLEDLSLPDLDEDSDPNPLSSDPSVPAETISDAPGAAPLGASDLEAPPEEPSLSPDVLTPVEHDPPLPRAKLIVETDHGRRTLYVYSGDMIQMGRGRVDYGGNDVCLRLFPREGTERDTRRISGRHLKVLVTANIAQILDLESTGGTTLNGRRLPAEVPQDLPRRGEVKVAGVLDLELAVLPTPASLPPAVVSRGGADAAAPSIYVTRPSNGSDQAYALVPGRIVLDSGANGLTPRERGEAELFAVDGGLWLRGGGLQPHECCPLRDGLVFDVGTLRVTVGKITPKDQK